MRIAIINLIILIGLFTNPASVYAQDLGKIKGKVVSDKGEELIGAIVSIEGTTKGASTDFNGEYIINSIAVGPYKINCRYVGFDSKSESVVIKKGEITILNFVLGEKRNVMEEVKITAKAKKENVSALLILQKNALSVSDGISSESIRKSPDKATSDVIKRISGASIQDNKFAIIRGLNERYNSAFINSAPLPSSETDRKAFAFDIFPSNMLENLIIYKTATPDQTGEFGGGIISVNTKGIPDENFNSINISLGYNTLTTFQNKTTYTGGKWDWLGFDDGTRAFPEDLPGLNEWPASRDDKAELAKKMPNDWGTFNNKNFLPSGSLQFTMGRVYKKKEIDKFGFLFSLTYSNSPTKFNQRLFDFDESANFQLQTDLSDDNYVDRILAGSMLNFSYKPSNKSTLSLKNIYSINSENRVVSRKGGFNLNQLEPLITTSNLYWFTSNEIISNQLQGDHYLSKTKTKLNWVISNSYVQRLMPGMRRLLYSQVEGQPSIANIATNADFAPSTGGTFLNTTNNENIRSAQIDISENIDFSKRFKNAVKFGFSIQKRERDFRARKLNFAKIQQAGGGIEFDDSLLLLSDKEIFDPANMGIQPNGKGGFMLEQIINPYDKYDASSFTYARYLMVDTKVGNMFRAIYGLRLESFYMNLQSTRDDRTPVDVNTLVVDYLPSLNIIQSLNEKQNLRFSYSKTLNRPEFRELAPFVFYDFTNRFTYSGNDTIQRCVIHNLDLRYELFPGKNQILSGSVFYKSFINPIEQRSNPNAAREVTYVNAENAENYGVEFEFRALLSSFLNKDTISWLDYLTVYSNLAIINSKVILSEKNKAIEADRRLQGQSNYVFNAGVQFQDFKSGLSATLSANRVGDRISIVGNVIEPDLWEKGRTVIDLQIGKNFFKNRLDVRLNIKDLLVQDQVFYNDLDKNQKYNADKDYIIISRNFGNEISISATFKF
jgi:hypothetical protein